MATLPQGGVTKLQIASIGSPLPNVGEGLGVRGIPSAKSIPVNRLWVGFPERVRELRLCARPLTPLPRWGEGDRDALSVSRDEGRHHHIL